MRPARLLVAAALLLSAPSALTTAAADPTPTPSAAVPEAPLQISVKDLRPRAPRPGDAFEVTGTVTNTGGTTVSRITLRLRLGDRIDSRNGLHEADTDRPITLKRAGTKLDLPDPLAPGAHVRFDLRTTVAALELGGSGVYPLDIEALGDLGSGTERLGLVPTWVPWFGSNPVRKTRVAVLWPLVDTPRQSVDGRFRDDDLASSVQPDGRLGRLLRAGTAAAVPECGPAANGKGLLVTLAPVRCESVPVTYAVDPDLLNAVGTMTNPYRVGTVNDTKPGGGTNAAKAFMSDLTTAVASTDVVALPYADPDVTALTSRRGSPFAGDLSRASLLGVDEVRQRLGVRPISAVAWPPVGRITTAGLDALSLTGATSYVLDASAYGQPDSEPDPTPGARSLLPASSIGATPTGLVVEDTLSALLTGGVSSYGARIDEQRFVAETAIIAAQSPRLQRTFVLAPERHAEVLPGAAAAALRDLGRLPWLCPVRLAEVAAGTEHCSDEDPAPAGAPAVVGDRGPLSQDRPSELPDTYLNPIGRDRDIAEQLTSEVLTDAVSSRAVVARMTGELRRSIARAESSAWRDDPAREQQAALLHRHMSDLVNRVTVRGGQVLLTSSSGRLQASLENRLDVPIRVRLRFGDNGAAIDPVSTGIIEVPPRNAVPAAVSVTTHKSGQFLVKAIVVDRAGEPFPRRGEARSASITVRSTGYGRLAIAVTLGGAGVLFLTAGVRIARRARSRS